MLPRMSATRCATTKPSTTSRADSSAGLQSLAGVLESWTQEIQDRDSAVDVEAKPHDSEDIPIDRGPVDRG